MCREIQSGAVAKSCMRKGFLIYEEMRKYFPMYEEAVSHVWLCNCPTLNILIRKIWFSFLSVYCMVQVKWHAGGKASGNSVYATTAFYLPIFRVPTGRVRNKKQYPVSHMHKRCKIKANVKGKTTGIEPCLCYIFIPNYILFYDNSCFRQTSDSPSTR